MGPMSAVFREVDPYLNPKNKFNPRPDVLSAAAKEAQEARLRRVYAHRYEKKTNRHPDWSPYYQPGYEGHDTSSRKNLVGGTHLVPMHLRHIPKTTRYDALDGGKAREAADRKAEEDKQGIPDWSPYFRGKNDPSSTRSPGRPPRPASACATGRSFSATSFTDPDKPLESSRHMFETTTRQRAREEEFFRLRRAARPKSASSSRRRAW